MESGQTGFIRNPKKAVTSSYCLLEQNARTFAFATLRVHIHSQDSLSLFIPKLAKGTLLPSELEQLPATTTVPGGQDDTHLVFLSLATP
jgi:hypothetical protein